MVHVPKKVLVANRGEIAVRVIRACREVGSAAVAVYSDVDRGALHVRLADEAYPIGEAPALKSYLDVEKVVAAARRAGCDAVHPGYGFLSENPDFAEAVERAGIAFAGPRPESMRLMGNKISARREATLAGVPTVPGGIEPIRDLDDLRARTAETGFPLVLKAARGGGGKGIRVVREAAELESAFRLASSEARSSFGSDVLFVERFLHGARHIEVQVLGDGDGGLIHLGERECSLQRRHQKLVEETPSPSIDDETRRRICDAAVALARRIAYRSAGTLEFLVERDDAGRWSRFYFMEMNMRLQVEHPVTEMVTGFDLVKAQLHVAAGGRLELRQEDIERRGAAIEVRINAEDPLHDFAPSAGTVDAVHWPSGPGTRVDTAIGPGDAISLYYDPLVAKVSVSGRNRVEAVRRLGRALRELRVNGVATTAPLLQRLVESPEFHAADFHIHFLEPFARAAMARSPDDAAVREAAIAAAVRAHARARVGRVAAGGSEGGSRAAGAGEPAWLRLARAEAVGRSCGP
jgi:acetyl-CoA carboxylase biotin carboxylase subunit